VDVEVLTTATTVLFLVERNNHWCYSFIAYRCRTPKLCCSYAVFKTVSRIARPPRRRQTISRSHDQPLLLANGGGGARSAHAWIRQWYDNITECA